RSQGYGRDNGCCEGNKTGHEPTADAHDAAELPVLFSVPAPDRVGNRTTLPLRTALPGRQQKFDITGGDPVGPSTRLQIVSRQPHELGGFHGVRARADPRPSALQQPVRDLTISCPPGDPPHWWPQKLTPLDPPDYKSSIPGGDVP